MPAKTVRGSRSPMSSVSLQQLVRAFDALGVDDAGDAQVESSRSRRSRSASRQRRPLPLGAWRGTVAPALRVRAGVEARLFGPLDQRIDLLRVDPLHQVLERPHALGRLPRVAPGEIAIQPEQLARHATRELRQHRREHHRQLLEALQRLRRDRLQRVALARVLRELPRLRRVERFVDAVGDAHRVAQHASVLARLVVRARASPLPSARS